MSATHHHAHDHPHHPVSDNKTILALSLLIIGTFMLLEFWGGWYFNSLVLLADAAHMANDSFSLLLALLALFLSAGKQRWFALFNGTSLLAVALYILYEALQRWQNPAALMALPMLAVASLGLLVNVLVAWLMAKGDRSNLNVKAAYLHVLADVFGSVVAIVAGLSAWLLGWLWVDVAASVLLSLFVFKSGWGIVRRVLGQWHQPAALLGRHEHHHGH